MTTTQPHTARTQAPQPHPQRWLILAVLCLTLLTVVFDNTVLNVALPSLTEGLGASTADVQWMINAYSIAMAGLLMAAGSAADRYGRKRALLAGLLLFGAGSAVATLADAPGQVIAARAAMGVGAALLTPCTLAVLVRVFDAEERRRAIGIWAAVSSLGIACGPVIGGLLLDHFWWGSIFLLNVPIAAIALIAVAVLVPESKDPVGDRPDVLGGVLSAVVMVALVASVIAAGDDGWASGAVWTGLLVCLTALVAFVFWQRRAAHPMLDLGLFADRRFTGAAAGGLLGAFGMAGALFLITQHLQFVLGFSPLTAGFAIAPLAVSTMISSTLLSARAGRRLGAGAAMAVGMAGAAAGLTVVALAGRDAGYPATVAGLVLIGLGVGLAMPVAAHALLGAIPPERAGTGSGLVQSLQEVGASLGVAVLGAVLTAGFGAGLPAGLGPDASRSLPTALSGAGGDPAVRDRVTAAFADGMTGSQLIAAAAVLCGGLLAGHLLRRAQLAAGAPAADAPSRS
ncbi:MFS transporter [Couchioplanes azureus]|uniref:MFS transporter n=1 Tax=Couchioplanes caeruleus TaxID=56438 RepID=UPI00166FE876|nr:MFS transporter [Couchioplanes caeruleus]GGQ76330.1 MFS transporter [Couchioplanes caeruleus subsp. azureus]